MKVRICTKEHGQEIADCFGAYAMGTAKAGQAEVIIDLEGIAAFAASGEMTHEQCRDVFRDTLCHELMHACEELAGYMYNCEAIDNAIAHFNEQQEAMPASRGTTTGQLVAMHLEAEE